MEKSTWEASGAEWEAEKRRFLNAIGDTGGADLSQSFLLRPEQSQIHDSTLGTRSALDSLEMVYADQVFICIILSLKRLNAKIFCSLVHESSFFRLSLLILKEQVLC